MTHVQNNIFATNMMGWKKTQSMSMLNKVLKIQVVEPHSVASAATVPAYTKGLIGDKAEDK